MKIKKGDKVKIILGKDRGKTGTVDYINVKKGRVFVGGTNLYKRHIKKQGTTEGGIIDIPKSMNISNVSLICPGCNKITRVGFKVTDRTKIRICKKCDKEIK